MSSSQEYLTLAIRNHQSGDLQNAEAYYKKEIELNPNSMDAYEGLGDLYRENAFYAESKNCYISAVKLEPQNAKLYVKLGLLFTAMLEYANAKVFFLQAIEINPELFESYLNLANVYNYENDYKNAIYYYQKALFYNVSSCDANNNIGACYIAMNDLINAQMYYERALKINPEHIRTRYNNSLLLLQKKEYIEGFKEYRYRYHDIIKAGKEGVAYRPTLLKKGESIEGKTLYINHEQGLGDTLQFARYFPFFLEQGAKIISYVPESLKRLFEHNYGDVEFFLPGIDISFDCNFPLCEASYLLGDSYKSIPFQESYLTVKQEDVLAFKEQHKIVSKKLKIGINYRGSQGVDAQKNRSLELELLLDTLESFRDKVEVYSIQYERSLEDDTLLENRGVKNLGREIKDFYDTALIVENMDLVVSIDTSVLHLCGAMGKESLALLKFAPDWRWSLEDKKTNWYSSLTLLRQTSDKDWQSVMSQLEDAIREKIS